MIIAILWISPLNKPEGVEELNGVWYYITVVMGGPYTGIFAYLGKIAVLAQNGKVFIYFKSGVVNFVWYRYLIIIK